MKKILALFLISTMVGINFGYAMTPAPASEHLLQSEKVVKKAPTNLVTFYTSGQATIKSYNLIEVTFGEDFSTKNAKVGDEIGFLLNNGLKTTEGTVILPEGTVLIGEITNIEMPKSFNRSGKVSLQFKYLETPDNERIPLNAKLFGNKNYLSRGKLNALGKGLGTTLGTSAVGIGAGCGIGAAASAVIVGGFAIGLPIGFAVGAVAGLVTPGLHYKAKAGDKLLIQLTDDLSVPQ